MPHQVLFIQAAVPVCMMNGTTSSSKALRSLRCDDGCGLSRVRHRIVVRAAMGRDRCGFGERPTYLYAPCRARRWIASATDMGNTVFPHWWRRFAAP